MVIFFDESTHSGYFLTCRWCVVYCVLTISLNGDQKLKRQNSLMIMAYHAIKEMMINSYIIPGQRLLFTDLADMLGVSRTPVNHALLLLSKEGYLDFIPNQGYSVHRLTRQEVENIFDEKEIHESGTITRVLALMTEKHASGLRRTKLAYEVMLANEISKKLFLFDFDFHSYLIAITGNGSLVQRYRDICLKLFLGSRTDDLESTYFREVALEHTKLFEAVLKKDLKSSIHIIKNHNFNDKKACTHAARKVIALRSPRRALTVKSKFLPNSNKAIPNITANIA